MTMVRKQYAELNASDWAVLGRASLEKSLNRKDAMILQIYVAFLGKQVSHQFDTFLTQWNKFFQTNKATICKAMTNQR